VLLGAAQKLLQHPNSAAAKRANFATHNLWATPFHPDELGCAGDNTVMTEGFDGLPYFTRNNRPIVDCDLVTWHTVGLTHVPRPEDWPIMPVEKARLNLIPVGFFDKSPVMDLPTGNGHCHMPEHHSKL
jgi:primary-amine oxidase